MRPKERLETGQTDLFKARLDQIVDLSHALVKLARSVDWGFLEKTFGAGPLILSSIRDAIPVVPSYSQQLVTLIGPLDLGTGFVWATLVGLCWLIAQSGVALVTERPRLNRWVLGWVVATLIWLPAMVTPWRDIASLHQTDAWVAVATWRTATEPLTLRRPAVPEPTSALLG